MGKTVRTRIIDTIKARIESVPEIAAVGETGNWPSITDALSEGKRVAAIAVTDDESLGEVDAHIGNAFSFLVIVEIVLPDLTAGDPDGDPPVAGVPYYENAADIYRLVRQAVMGTDELAAVDGLVTRIDCIGGGGVGFHPAGELGQIEATAVGFEVHYRHDWHDPEVAR